MLNLYKVFQVRSLVTLSLGLTTLLAGCGDTGSLTVGSPEVLLQEGSPNPLVGAFQPGQQVTLFFDGDAQVFSINDLGVALALLVLRDPDVPEIQDFVDRVLGIRLNERDILGAGPDPLANFDLNGDGSRGTLGDFGVALAALIGAPDREVAEQICVDVLGIPCEIGPEVVIPGPEATPFPEQGPVAGSGVNTLTDSVVDNPEGCSLREAIIANNTNQAFGGCANPQGRIQFAEALVGTIRLQGDLPAMSADVEIIGPGSSRLAVSGNGQHRPFEIVSGVSATISGLAIVDGQTSELGGGILVAANSTLTIVDSLLEGNRAGRSGGALHNESGAELIIRTTTLRNNQAARNNGGALSNAGTVTISDSEWVNNRADDNGGAISNASGGDLSITDSTFRNNSARRSDGGALFSSGSGSFAMVSSRFENNQAGSRGGAISTLNFTGTQEFTISDSNFVGNQAPRGGALSNTTSVIGMVMDSRFENNQATRGGAIANDNGGRLTLDNSIISNNTADNSGGGLDNGSGNRTALTLNESTVTNNQASDGGGLNLNGSTSIRRSLIANNQATTVGGGIHVRRSVGPLAFSLVNSTVSGNQSAQGGGILSDGTLTVMLVNSTITANTSEGGGGLTSVGSGNVVQVRNTLLSGNQAPVSPECLSQNGGTFALDSHNLLGFNGSAGGCPAGSSDIVPAVPVNEILDPLADNGGSTLTHALPSGSPAINQGSNDLAVLDGLPLETDQRGSQRIVGGMVDIGAFEVQ